MNSELPAPPASLHRRRRRFTARGASFVELLVLIGCVGLGLATTLQLFASSLEDAATKEGKKLLELGSAEVASAPARSGDGRAQQSVAMALVLALPEPATSSANSATPTQVPSLKLGEPLTPLPGMGSVIASQSPTLSAELLRLREEGWTIEFNPDPKSRATYTNSGTKSIVLSQSYLTARPEHAVQALAHEVGHASNRDPNVARPIENPEWRTHDQYVEGNTAHLLEDEVDAQLFNGKVRAEILAKGGPDIGINGSEASLATYDLYANGHITAEQARTLMVEDWRSSHPSTDPTSTYGEQYRDRAIASDNRTREPDPPSKAPPATTPSPSPGPTAKPPSP